MIVPDFVIEFLRNKDISIVSYIGTIQFHHKILLQCVITWRQVTAVVLWFTSCLVEQGVRGSNPNVASWILEIGHLLLPSSFLLNKIKATLNPKNNRTKTCIVDLELGILCECVMKLIHELISVYRIMFCKQLCNSYTRNKGVMPSI